MKRRSFFRTLFGGFLAQWLPLPTQIRFRGAVIPIRQYWPHNPQYHFGFTGFKPAQAHRGVADKYFGSSPLEGGTYTPGDTFEIIGPGGRGTALLQKVDTVDIGE